MTHHDHRPLDGKRAAVMIGPLFEDTEATYPYYRLQEAGAEVELIGLEGDATVNGKHGQPLVTDRAASDVSADELDVLVIAGGFGPDKLRVDDGVKRLVGAMNEQGKPIAFICHAGWVPISAGILEGRRATSVQAIADDMRNAGAEWEDSEVVVDGNLVSSRRPPDLPAFMRELIGVAERSEATVTAQADVSRLTEYGFGHVNVDGVEHTNDVIVLPDRVVSNWWRRDGHSLVMEDLDEVIEELPERLVVGCGADGRLHPDPGVAAALARRGVEMEALPTAQAVERYSELESVNPAAVAAALHLTC